MELKDTISMMDNLDYKERFKAEYYQLKIRLNKLTTMLQQLDAGELKFKPDSPVVLLTTQKSHMEAYLNCLELRASAEGIAL